MTIPQASKRGVVDLTPYVTLDELHVDHVGPEYHNWLSDPEVMRFLEARFRAHSMDDIRSYVKEINASKTDHLWRILCDGRHVGNIKLGGISQRHRRANLSLLIGDRSVWGQSVATRAIRLATAESFKRYGLHKIYAGFYAANVASIRAFEKAGYIIEATLRGNRCLDGQMVDEVLMACFREALEDGNGQ
jgi:RimJ/RimL family protein N-acetyltransferase